MDDNSKVRFTIGQLHQAGVKFSELLWLIPFAAMPSDLLTEFYRLHACVTAAKDRDVALFFTLLWNDRTQIPNFMTDRLYDTVLYLNKTPARNKLLNYPDLAPFLQ